jgi:hypothetical protein
MSETRRAASSPCHLLRLPSNPRRAKEIRIHSDSCQVPVPNTQPGFPPFQFVVIPQNGRSSQSSHDRRPCVPVSPIPLAAICIIGWIFQAKICQIGNQEFPPKMTFSDDFDDAGGHRKEQLYEAFLFAHFWFEQNLEWICVAARISTGRNGFEKGIWLDLEMFSSSH